jgi:cytochrome c oxidase assembly factor 6
MWILGTAKSEEVTAPSRQDRQKCWETRDAYFACLDSAGVVKAGEEGKVCDVQKTSYEQNCAKSWVCVAALFCKKTLVNFWLKIEYFNQRRVIAEAQKDRLAQANMQARDAKK